MTAGIKETGFFPHLFASQEVSRQKPGFSPPTNDDKINLSVILYPLAIMDENRAQAYLQLINALLTCPNGEEPEILQDNLELLDQEFLLVCEVIAENLAEEGGENAANFLRNLVSQLGQLFGMNDEADTDNSEGENPQEYEKFIRELLQAEAESNHDIKVIYPMLAKREHLLNARFAEILQQVAEKLIADKEPEIIESIVAIIENLSIHISNFPRGNRANNIEIAITGYQIVLNNRQPGSEKFAQSQNNLANAYSNRIKGDRADNIESAIALYQEALTVRTLKDFREDWAMTKNNLANAYYDRIKGDRADNIESAIAFYEEALTVYTFEDFREDWAMTKNNLAIAYSDRIKGDRADNIESAIAFDEEALTVRTLKDFPEKWAMTKNNLAAAYSDRIKGDRADNIECAIAFCHEALTVYTFEDFREDWAMTKNNLAAAYSDRIKGDRADNIECAIAFCHEALTVRTLKDFPENWATTKNNLAIAYRNRIKGDRAENIESAIAFYEEALTVSTREAFPFENVQTLNNLGWAYLAKLDYINGEKPEDTNQRAATINSAYDTFKDAITGAENLRKLIQSSDEIKQKHDVEWDCLYKGMVQVCLDRDSNREALEYAEANKARNLAEVIAQKQEIPNTLKPITFTEITKLLTTPDTALIEWYITDAEIITFVLTYPDVLTVHRSRQWDELTDLAYEYRKDYKKSIKERNTDWQTQLPRYLERLAELLEITTILPAESTRLILIPHWFLHLFPLHALPLSDGQFLLDKFPQGIQYAPSCQLLQQIKTHPKFDQLLALQNPTEDLVFTDVEVTSIAPKFSIREILPGAKASKDNLFSQYLAQLEDAHCAHFSCHGSFNADDPLRSFLILAGGLIDTKNKSAIDEEVKQTQNSAETTPETPEENPRYATWRDGKTADITKCLTLEEIFQLKLKQCRLVVLSACETALIDTKNRSDYIGLPTGFLYAGAMGTLASLWAVNDISTALIMVKFYEVLKPGVSIGQALHDTQRWFKSAYTSDLLEWVESSDSFDDEQKEAIEDQLGSYNLTVKPYGSVYHWGAFCAIGL
jgi:CHAT domain-containing protein